MNGYVVDMFNLQFMNFAVFNIADIFVTVFGIIFCVCLVTGKVVDKEEVIAVLPGTNRSSERKQNVDYITQLKKPVVEGKEAIETELAAKSAPKTAVIHAEDTGFGTWNMPEDIAAEAPAPKKQPEPFVDPFADAKQRPAAPAPLGEAPAVRSATPAPAPSAKAAAFDDPFKEVSKAPSKDGDFNLEDIIAEFKD